MLTIQEVATRPSFLGLLSLHIGKAINLTLEQMAALRQLNPGLRLEFSGQGDLEMSNRPTTETHWRTNKLYMMLANWTMDDRSGVVFDDSTCFVLPNGAMRSPDLAWVRKSRLVQHGIKRKRPKLLTICPDVVIRLRNGAESETHLVGIMREFMASGTEIGWLIDAANQSVRVFSQGEPELLLEKPSSISGEPVLEGFSLHPDLLWIQH